MADWHVALLLVGGFLAVCGVFVALCLRRIDVDAHNIQRRAEERDRRYGT